MSNFFNYEVYCGSSSSLEKVLSEKYSRESSRCEVINCLNPHSFVVAKRDRRFRDALMNSDYLLADGVGITLASRLFGTITQRITGFDVFLLLLNLSNSRGLKVLFLGSDEETLAKIQKKCMREYPNIAGVDVYCPPFRVEFNLAEKQDMLAFINNRGPDVIFLGLSAPKQEKLSLDFQNFVTAKYMASIGAVFDFYVGNVSRPPKYIRQIGLEWLFRLLQQPKRLASRSFISAPVFVFDVVKRYLQKL